jgi:hypothetical protein
MESNQNKNDTDLESQVSASSGASGPPTEWVGTALSPSKALLWQSRVGTKPVGPLGHHNPHGMLAAQRFVLEKEACEILLGNGDSVVVDVGGAPHRTFGHLGQRGRFVMPALHVGDYSRIGRTPHGVDRSNICHHRFEECYCWREGPYSLLFVHSAYYIEPYALWRSLNEDACVDALVVEHVFDDVFGGFYDEASWSVSVDTVTMRVDGNAAPYVHVLPPWQRGWLGTGGEAFEVETLKQLDGVTRLLRVIPVLRDVPTDEALTWDQVEVDPHRSGPVQFSSAVRNAVADNARFTQVTFDVQQVRKIGPYLYTDFLFKGEKHVVTLPVNGVSLVAANVVNRTRDAVLYQEVTHNLKNRWARARIPPALLARTIAATVALGFVVNVHYETNLMYTMLSRFSWVFEAHRTLLAFGRLAVNWTGWLIFGAVLTLVGYVTFESLYQDQAVQIAVGLLFPALLLGTYFCVRCAFRTHQHWRDYTEAGWVSNLADEESPRAPLLGTGFTLTRNLPIPGSKLLKPDAPKIQGELAVGATRELESEPKRSLVSGVVLDGALPSVLATTQAAEKCAVTNRILAPRRNPEDEALKAYKVNFAGGVFKAVKGGVDTGYSFFRTWLQGLKKTYPQVYIDKMESEWKANQGVECPPTATKAFLKIEKSAATVGTDFAKPTKARLIQPPEDVDKAMTGPIIVQLYERIREAWNGFDSPVLYCSGYTNQYIGSAVDNFIALHGEVAAWSVDMASYDATLCLDLQLAAFEWYKQLGMPGWLGSWLQRVRTRGVTPNGVKYMPVRRYFFLDEKEAHAFALVYKRMKLRVSICKGIRPDGDSEEDGWLVEVEDFQMTSGRMDTNLTDTVCLVATFTGLLNVPYLLLACGDDAFLLMRKVDIGVVEEIKKFQLALGLNPEGSVSDSRARWEFCSKLFWYATNDDGRTITVLGSKPFRGIARMGMNTTLPGAANAAQAALAVRIDSGHVPFLGPFADATYRLCAAKKVRPVGKVEWAAIRGSRRYSPNPLNYAITQERYGLGRESEAYFEQLLATLHTVPIVVSWIPALDAVRVDEE